MLSKLVITIFTFFKGARERAGRLGPRVALDALPPTGTGSELSGPGWQAGAVRPQDPRRCRSARSALGR
jgi:hypothetical protein